jgi:cation diffusion facilitator CzcD-associated flavoprotein CzcO/acetyl esterase/lipase
MSSVKEQYMRTSCDVAVIGAGFAGLYAVHKFRDQLGLSVAGFDAAGGPGGTWWWNRYPGARCDIESVHYSYSFSDEIQRNWQWSERYAAQPEILAYLEYVADTLNVRKDFTFGTRVVSAVWNDDTKRWAVTTDSGASYTARFVIAASGSLSLAKEPEFPGLGDFNGPVYVTSSWPHEEVDLRGKRVGVIGTGSTGIQLIQEVGKLADHLTVFQRTPNYATPLRNEPLSSEQSRWLADNHADVRAGARESFAGIPFDRPRPSSHAASPEERRAHYDALWDKGGFRLLISSYADILVDQEANDYLASYVRDRIRERVKDPKTAELLCPTDHPFATKRPPLEADYYEVYNRDNVQLVDIRTSPIQRVTETGLQTADGEYPLDVLILATGFDAITGPLLKLGLVGRGGVTLNEHWADGPRTYLGIAVHGFPNLFTIAGPTSAAVFYNLPLAVEDHVDLAAAAVEHVIENGVDTIEATVEAEGRWQTIADGLLHMTLFPKADSWYMGRNVPGKPQSTFIFLGSAALYRWITANVQATDFGGFAVGARARDLPAMVKLDPTVLALADALLMQGTKPLQECSIEEIRARFDAFAQLQGPLRDVEVIEATYPGPGGDVPVRVYVPDADTPLPVMVFYHGGGFVAGGIDAADKPARALAEDLGVIVVAPSYRLAPEYPFPAATDDAYAALRWAADNIAQYGGDAGRIVVAGESSGGNLATVAALRARDKDGPRLVSQVLITPITDGEANTASRREYADVPILTTAALDMMWATYIGDTENSTSPLASPARAASLAGLPPALIITMECDPLRDEAEDYGRALADAGTPVTVRRLDGLVHGTFGLGAAIPRSREITEIIAQHLSPIVDLEPNLVQ